MNLLQIAQTASAIHKEILHHKEMGDTFSKLFNDSNPVPGEYTPIQEFLQVRYNYHFTMAVVAERRMARFQELSNNTDAGRKPVA